jgi:hypothetical protein
MVLVNLCTVSQSITLWNDGKGIFRHFVLLVWCALYVDQIFFSFLFLLYIFMVEY